MSCGSKVTLSHGLKRSSLGNQSPSQEARAGLTLTTTPFIPHTFFNDMNPDEHSRGASAKGTVEKGRRCYQRHRWRPGPAAAGGIRGGRAAPLAAAGRWPPPPPSGPAAAPGAARAEEGPCSPRWISQPAGVLLLPPRGRAGAMAP